MYRMPVTECTRKVAGTVREIDAPVSTKNPNQFSFELSAIRAQARSRFVSPRKTGARRRIVDPEIVGSWDSQPE